nr:keratin, type I cytoskeletal 9-like [Aegilops tauschii subsp. strangulata]
MTLQKRVKGMVDKNTSLASVIQSGSQSPPAIIVLWEFAGAEHDGETSPGHEEVREAEKVVSEGDASEVETLKNALDEAKKEAEEERAARLKHEARLDEVQQDLKDAIRKSEYLERKGRTRLGAGDHSRAPEQGEGGASGQGRLESGAAKATGRGTRPVRRLRGGAGGTGAGHGERRPVAANGGRARRRELAREQPGGEGGHRQARQCARVRAGETGRGGAAMGAFRGAGARVRTASWRPRAAGGRHGGRQLRATTARRGSREGGGEAAAHRGRRGWAAGVEGVDGDDARRGGRGSRPVGECSGGVQAAAGSSATSTVVSSRSRSGEAEEEGGYFGGSGGCR